MAETIINSHDSIIFLNGNLDKNLLPLINLKEPLIAADGAINTMKGLNLEPSWIVGDGDSCKNVDYSPKKPFIKISDQNSTDFEKCISHALNNKLQKSLVLGVNGGEIDHILGNAQVMLKHCDELSLYFLDTYYKEGKMGIKLGIPVSNKLNLHLKKRCTISFISFDNAHVKSKGLFWELNDPLRQNGILSLRNINTSDHIEIEVKKGKVLAIIDISGFF